jgi:mannitol-1-/sugar-/sorbitol-6-phosphatase
VVTSGTRFLAKGRIIHLGLQVSELFVSADHVATGKPHPEAYLKGPQILNARPEACVVVEDALSGMRAARVAGMRVVALTTTYLVEDLHQGARESALVNLQIAGRTGPTRGGESRFELSILG